MADVSGRTDRDRDGRPKDAVVPYDAPIPAWVGSNATAALSVSREVYPLRAVLSTAYKLSDRCVVLVDTDGDERWALYVIARAGDDVRVHLESLIRELGDQALRVRLEEEFGALRTLIVAQAFAEGNLLDPTRDDADNVGDPRYTGDRR